MLSVYLAEQGTVAASSTPSLVLLEATHGTFSCLLVQLWNRSSTCHTHALGATSVSQLPVQSFILGLYWVTLTRLRRVLLWGYTPWRYPEYESWGPPQASHEVLLFISTEGQPGDLPATAFSKSHPYSPIPVPAWLMVGWLYSKLLWVDVFLSIMEDGATMFL